MTCLRKSAEGKSGESSEGSVDVDTRVHKTQLSVSDDDTSQ